MLQSLYNTGWSYLTGLLHPAYGYARLGRLLLSVISIVLLALPFTQNLWTWDRFLHGGQDFETCVLLIVTSLCLVLVMVRGCKQWLDLLLAFLSGLALSRRHLSIARLQRQSRYAGNHRPSPPLASYSSPLLI